MRRGNRIYMLHDRVFGDVAKYGQEAVQKEIGIVAENMANCLQHWLPAAKLHNKNQKNVWNVPIHFFNFSYKGFIC